MERSPKTESEPHVSTRGKVLRAVALCVVTIGFTAAASGADEPKSAQALPRTSQGKVDFSGLFGASARDDVKRSVAAKKLPLTAWGQKEVTRDTSGDGKYAGETGDPRDPRFHRLCGGAYSPADMDDDGDVEIVQTPERLLIIYYLGRHNEWVRQVWIGRKHPQDLTDYNPVWMGHSVAKWEGDTLVVDTVGIREGTLLDHNSAAPQSGNLHMIERFHLTNGGESLQIDRTFEDPMAYTKPWGDVVIHKRWDGSTRVGKRWQPDWNAFADDWEISETHLVCEGGTYPKENDPWFDTGAPSAAPAAPAK